MTTNQENLISKKDLLKETGISYGQLYRWKRKSLIPESWFIRKSTFTGQETFFPRDQVLERVAQILELKDQKSLDELSVLFHLRENRYKEKLDQITRKILLERNIVSNEVFSSFEDHSALPTGVIKEKQLVSLFLYDGLLQSGMISLDEGGQLITFLETANWKLSQDDLQFILIRKLGVLILLLTDTNEFIQVDKGSKIIYQNSLKQLREEIVKKLQ
ncbi:DUF4004 family protein [Risungbinella massiliensis]|uniref:DUF4004 family protein n=1 Tax=Risungbinella massiliensis TaxID=1329796 RepID=UPI0005CBDED4|nr:DUF4004 family protein [Risungbinella massiliensis]